MSRRRFFIVILFNFSVLWTSPAYSINPRVLHDLVELFATGSSDGKRGLDKTHLNQLLAQARGPESLPN